jgi:hypothetical protein
VPTPDTGTGPGWTTPLQPGGSTVAGAIDVTNITDPSTRSLIANVSQQVDGYATQLATIGTNYQQQASRLAEMDQTDPGYAAQVRLVDSLANSWASVQNNYARAMDTRAQTIQKAIDSRWIQGPQQELWSAQAQRDRAESAKAASDVQIAQQNAGAQRDLLIAQSTASTAQANLTNAQATNLTSKTPAEIQQLQAAAAQAIANANLLNQQAGKTAAETQQLQAQAAVAPRAAEATTGTLEAQRGIAERNLANMPTSDLAQATNVAATQTAQAGAAQAEANVGKTVLGPTFGLQQQIAAIKQIADQMRNGAIPFSGDPDQAIQNMNDSLNRYLQATIGGTTPAAASVAAQQAQEQQRAQDITQRQQDTTLQGQGMTGAASAFGSAISPLIGAVKDLPAGSTALGPAAAAMFAPFLAAAGGGLVKPPPQVAAPALPPFLQSFLSGGGGVPQTSAPVTINIGGGGSAAPPSAAPVPAVTAAAPAAQPTPFAQSGLGEGGSRGNLPSFMQGSQIGTPDFVDQLKQDTLSKIQSWGGAG